MKNKLGIIVILFSIVITWVFWLFIEPTRTISGISQYSQLLAAFALVGLAVINFISTRHKALDKMFNGLDTSYIYHKYLSITVLIIIIIHNITIEIGKKSEIAAGISISRDPYAMYGAFSMYLFIIIILIALLAKKLNYERWKVIHKFMIIPYAFGIYHYYGSATYEVFSLSAFSIWLNIVNLIGISSAIYSIFFYEKTAFKHHFKVIKLEEVADGTVEITGKSFSKDINFEPGQFAFIKIPGKNSSFPSHPFTISEAPKNGEIQFTIKGLGDHTKALFNTIKVDDEFMVSGPHGKFNYKTGSKNQIWIAGGIGITPFRSFYQSGVPKEYSVDFFYAYNNDNEASYLEEMQNLIDNDNVRLHLFNSKEKGFLTIDKISALIKIDKPVDIYFCGPKPMRESLQKQLKNSNIKVKDFHYEHFQFK